VKMICRIITVISPSPISCATLPTLLVMNKSMVSVKSNLAVDVLIHVLTNLHHLLYDTSKMSMISICGYSNLDH
jgi:hypothetical protein